MSCLLVKMIDTQCPDETVEIGELTELGIGCLIYDCELLLEELREAREIVSQEEG